MLSDYINTPEFEKDYAEYELELVMAFAYVPREFLDRAHARLMAARDFRQHIMERYHVKTK